MLKVASVVDVDAFIEQATRIADKVKRNPNLSAKAKQEARLLLEQLEEYLDARMRACDNPPKRRCNTRHEEQPIEAEAPLARLQNPCHTSLI